METNCVLLVMLLLAPVAVDFSSADSKVNESASTGLDPSLNGTNDSKAKTGGSSNLVANTTLVGKVNDEVGDQVSGSKDDTIDKKSSSKQSELKEGNNVENGKGVLSEESKKKEGDDKKEKLDDGVKPKEVPKDGGNEGDSDMLRKEGSRGEECGSSNMCTVMDEENKFVACLRVPGNDSPDLSLLIQNKGKGPLSITISAPDFVKLDKTKVQLHEKENKKVIKVSVRNGGTDNLITLTAGNGHCSLDFRDLIAHNSEEESDNSPKFTYLNYLSRKPTIAFLSFAALLILASGWMCCFWRRQLSSNGSKYQRLDMELPVSGVGKSESINDGWDNSWGDDWEDEEAPKTPPMPVTPSLSSKGLASRRLNKEGWKD